MSERNVLIIDDNATNLELYGELVDMAGHSATMVNRAELVMDAALTHKPNLILLDLTLPNSSGFKVIQDLRANADTSHIPVMALTALQREDLVETLKNDGFSGLITKPCGVETFLNALDWGLSGQQLDFRVFDR